MNIEEKSKLFESLTEKFKTAGISEETTNSIVSDIKQFISIVEQKIDNIIKNNEAVITEQISKLINENQALVDENKKYKILVEKISQKTKNVIDKITKIVNESFTALNIDYNEKLLKKNVNLHRMNNFIKNIIILEDKKNKEKDVVYMNKIKKIIPKIVKETIDFTKEMEKKNLLKVKKNILEKVNNYIENFIEEKTQKTTNTNNIIPENIKTQKGVNTIQDTIQEKQENKDNITEDKNKITNNEQTKINNLIDLSSPTQIYVNKEVLNESILTDAELDNLIKSSARILNESEKNELIKLVNNERGKLTKSRFNILLEKIKNDFEQKYMSELANNMTSYDVSVVSEIINNDVKIENDLIDIVAENLKKSI